MNTMITDAAVAAAADKLSVTGYPIDDRLEFAHAALEAALPLLAPAPEAANPVSVSERERFEAWAANEFGWGDIEFRRFDDDSYLGLHAHTAWRAWQAARQPVTMDDALAAGDGTLHGAIDHWQKRALRAEAERAGREPVGEAVAWQVKDEDSDWEWAWADKGVYLMVKRHRPHHARELFTTPPQQPERVDCGWIIEQIAQQWDGCNYDAVGETIDVGEAIRMTSQRLINQQESKP